MGGLLGPVWRADGGYRLGHAQRTAAQRRLDYVFPARSTRYAEQRQIVEGEYDIPRQNGLKPGRYLVRLTSGDGKTIARGAARHDKNPPKEQVGAPGGTTNIVSMDRIPEEWNVRSKQEKEVKANGVNRFDFNIPNANTSRKNR